jgi:hypothetical protein
VMTLRHHRCRHVDRQRDQKDRDGGGDRPPNTRCDDRKPDEQPRTDRACERPFGASFGEPIGESHRCRLGYGLLFRRKIEIVTATTMANTTTATMMTNTDRSSQRQDVPRGSADYRLVEIGRLLMRCGAGLVSRSGSGRSRLYALRSLRDRRVESAPLLLVPDRRETVSVGPVLAQQILDLCDVASANQVIAADGMNISASNLKKGAARRHRQSLRHGFRIDLPAGRSLRRGDWQQTAGALGAARHIDARGLVALLEEPLGPAILASSVDHGHRPRLIAECVPVIRNEP